MTKDVTLELKQITIDDDIQPRTEINHATVEDYADDMREGRWDWKRHPLPVVFQDGDTYRLASGFHRFEACKIASKRTIPADVRLGSKRDAILYAVGTNTDHGLRRSNADKRRAVLKLLEDQDWRLWSDQMIAKRVGVSHGFVGRLRHETSTGFGIQLNTPRTYERNGQIQQMNTGNIATANESRASQPDQSAVTPKHEHLLVGNLPLGGKLDAEFPLGFWYVIRDDTHQIYRPGFKTSGSALNWCVNIPQRHVWGSVQLWNTLNNDYTYNGYEIVDLPPEAFQAPLSLDPSPTSPRHEGEGPGVRAAQFAPDLCYFVHHPYKTVFTPGWTSYNAADDYRQKQAFLAQIISGKEMAEHIEKPGLYKTYTIVAADWDRPGHTLTLAEAAHRTNQYLAAPEPPAADSLTLSEIPIPTPEAPAEEGFKWVDRWDPVTLTTFRTQVPVDPPAPVVPVTTLEPDQTAHATTPVETASDPTPPVPVVATPAPRKWWEIVDPNLYYGIGHYKRHIDPTGYPTFEAAKAAYQRLPFAVRKGRHLLDAYNLSKQYADYIFTTDISRPTAAPTLPPQSEGPGAAQFDLISVYLSDESNKVLYTDSFKGFDLARSESPSAYLRPIDGAQIARHWVDKYAAYTLSTLAARAVAERDRLRFHQGEDKAFCSKCNRYHDSWGATINDVWQCSICMHQEKDSDIKIERKTQPDTDTPRSQWEALGGAAAKFMSNGPAKEITVTLRVTDRTEGRTSAYSAMVKDSSWIKPSYEIPLEDLKLLATALTAHIGEREAELIQRSQVSALPA